MKKNLGRSHAQMRPCTQWATRLAVLRPRDLLARENADVAAHLDRCLACRKLYDEYQEVARMIQSLPDLHMPAGLPPQLLEEWGEAAKNIPPLPPALERLVKALSEPERGLLSSPSWPLEEVRSASAGEMDEWLREMPELKWFC